MQSPFTLQALRLGGLLTWLSVAVLLSIGLLTREPTPWGLPPGRLLVWLAAFGVYGLAFWAATDQARPTGVRRAWCAALSLCALACLLTFPGAATSTLFILVTAALPGVLPWTATLAVAAAQTLALALVLLQSDTLSGTLRAAVPTLLGQAVAALLVYLTHAERQGRRELAELNVKLRFTRALLEDATRGAERTRITRELHDVLGHHLTIMGLELEYAAHLSTGESRNSVERARALGRLLLGEVRAAVGDWRSPGTEWERLTGDVIGPVPGLNIHLKLDPGLKESGPGVQHTQAVLRFMQEVVTNAVRHAQAGNVWFELSLAPNGLVLRGHDDGQLRQPPVPGHGLTGLRERFEDLGGQLSYAPRPEGGLRLEATLPLGPEA